VVCPDTMGTVPTKSCEKCRRYKGFGKTEPDPKTKDSYRTVLCEGYFGLSDKEIEEYKGLHEEFIKRKDAERAERESKKGTREAAEERYTHPHNVNDL